jgi:hypothetical protein
MVFARICTNFTLNITYYLKNKLKKEDLFEKKVSPTSSALVAGIAASRLWYQVASIFST